VSFPKDWDLLMRPTVLGLAAILTASAGSSTASQNVSKWSGPDHPVYVVIPNTFSAGSAASSTKFGDWMMVQIFPDPPQGPNGARPDRTLLYKVGQRTAFYVDGERRGDVIVDVVRDNQCDSIAAVVKPSLAGVSATSVGLATNTSGLASRASTRRNATSAEAAQIRSLAINELTAHGASSSLAAKVTADSLVAVQVDATGETTFVGSFHGQDEHVRHHLFLAARIRNGKAAADLAIHGKTTDLEDRKDLSTITFVDHLDLNHNGVDELVLLSSGYEWQSYLIVERQNGKWVRVAEGGGAGC